MKIAKLILFLSIISTVTTSAQSNLELGIENLQTSSDSLFIRFSITNKGKKIVRIYKPESQDICYGIVRILINDVNGNKYQIMPCNEIIDLDAITLCCKNSLYLSENEIFSKQFKFSLKNAVPFLPTKVILNATMEINLKDAPFEGDVDDLVRYDYKTKNETKFKL